MRHDGRAADQLREVKIVRQYTRYAQGSVLIQTGNTTVLCTAMIEDKVPPFLRGSGKGWISAEDDMLPSANAHRRIRDRNKNKIDGRTMVIQRLIGRSLRSVVDLTKLGERTLWVDCDVIQADGGTRSASITGAYVAVVDAIQFLMDRGSIKEWPIKAAVAATSVGIFNENSLLDLCYVEDVEAAVDMNIVMTSGGEIVEIQGTGEERPFTEGEMQELIALGKKGLQQLFQMQKEALNQ
ncbi:MAG: ribonuclease PH [Eubacteriaceae bacterium]|nr:ribonuclease PH [Eubacteriaceae bacterium]